MIDLYVYYKLAPEHEAAVLALVPVIQARLAAAHGVRPQLKRRPAVRDGLHTWMEIYPAVDDDFASVLEQALKQGGFASLNTSARHTEVFVDALPCV